MYNAFGGSFWFRHSCLCQKPAYLVMKTWDLTFVLNAQIKQGCDGIISNTNQTCSTLGTGTRCKPKLAQYVFTKRSTFFRYCWRSWCSWCGWCGWCGWCSRSGWLSPTHAVILCSKNTSIFHITGGISSTQSLFNLFKCCHLDISQQGHQSALPPVQLVRLLARLLVVVQLVRLAVVVHLDHLGGLYQIHQSLFF